MLNPGDVVGGDVSDARYDRQIRLWGKQGQRALQEATIVALGATATVCAALKSVILTGVRSVVVVDERRVRQDDIATNFFLAVEDMGAPLAERAVGRLCELNAECAGLAVCDQSPAEWVGELVRQMTISPDDDLTVKKEGTGPTLERISAFMHKATPVANKNVLAQEGARPREAALRLPSLILVSNRYPDWSSASPLVRLVANVLNIPVLVVESRGLSGYLQVFARDRVVANPHPQPDQLIEDLRIFEPFPELKEWFTAHNPDDDTQFRCEDPDSLNAHSHLPYTCILYHAYQRYLGKCQAEQRRRERGGGDGDAPNDASPAVSWPMKKADFEALKKEIRCLRKREDPPQEGFQEALQNCYLRLNRPLVLQPSVAALFADPRADDPMQTLAASPGWELLGDGERRWSDRGPANSKHARTEDSPRAGDTNASLSLSPLLDTEYVLSWLTLHAIKRFYETSDAVAASGAPQPQPQRRHKVLPLCGHVPDMSTLTQWFQELRGIYHTKHEADVKDIQARVSAYIAEQYASCRARAGELFLAEGDRAVVEDRGQLRDAEAKYPMEGRLKAFASRVHAADIHAIAKDLVANVWYACPVSFSKGFAIDAEVYASASTAGSGSGGAGSDRMHVAWALVLRRQTKKALEAFASYGEEEDFMCSKRACGVGVALYAVHERQRRGGEGGTTPAVFPSLKALVTRDGQEPWVLGAGDTALLEKLCWEVERVGRAEVPSVAATIGALAAQEVIKLVQRRRVPTTYPMVYCGIDGVYANMPATA